MDRDDLQGPEDDETTPFLDHTRHNFKEGLNPDQLQPSPKISQENEIPVDEDNIEPLIDDEENTYGSLYDVLHHNIVYAFFFKNNDTHKPFSIFIIPVTVCIITTIYLCLWIKYDGCKTKYYTPDGFPEQCKSTYDCINATVTGKTFIPKMNPDYTLCSESYCQYSNYKTLCWGIFNFPWGGLIREKVFKENEWWRTFTMIVHHINWSHISQNMIGLLFFGCLLEKKYGGFIILMLFIISGWGSSMYILSPMSGMKDDSIIVGASGGIYGVLSMLFIEQFIAPRFVVCRYISIIVLVVIIILFIIEPFAFPSNSTAGHVGGFITGICLSIIYIPLYIKPIDRDITLLSDKWKILFYLIGFFGIIINLVIFISFFQFHSLFFYSLTFISHSTYYLVEY